MVGQERARLLGIAKKQADFEASLARSRKEFTDRTEETLAWIRRVRETIDGAARGATDSAAIDATYDALRAELRSARANLATSLDALGSEASFNTGDDPLKSLPPDVDVSPATQKRAEVETEGKRLAALEVENRLERARADYEEVQSLNLARLTLYADLSSTKRSAITGFGAAGADQARAEVRQVALVLRYHSTATLRWIRSLRTPGAERGQSAIAATFLALEWLLPLALFIWWRRRAPAAFERRAFQAEGASHEVGPRRPEPFRARAGVHHAHSQAGRMARSMARRGVALADRRCQSPRSAALCDRHGLGLGGSLVVASVDALASEPTSRSRASRLVSAHIRLRSLRLVGWVVVSVGLVLSLTDKIVGKGTIYSWVFSTCWFAAIPITMLLVRWWRPIIFERVDLKRKKSAFDRWVLAHKSGWRSLLSAIAGGAYLFGVGAYTAARSWISTFELTRRLLAYLFRRDITRRAGALEKLELARLPPSSTTSSDPRPRPARSCRAWPTTRSARSSSASPPRVAACLPSSGSVAQASLSSLPASARPATTSPASNVPSGASKRSVRVWPST